IFLDMDTKTFKVLNTIREIRDLSENDVYVSTITFTPDGALRSVDIGCDYRVNGVLSSRVKDGLITSDVRTRLGERLAIMCLEATPDIINDEEAKELIFHKNTRFYTGKYQFQIKEITTLELSKGSDHNLIFLNIKTGEFTVLN